MQQLDKSESKKPYIITRKNGWE